MSGKDGISGKISIQGQTVLFNNSKEDLTRTMRYIAGAVKYSREHDLEINLRYVWGDASPKPVFSEAELSGLKEELAPEVELNYIYFNENTGTSLGHNRMAEGCKTDYLWIMNPDIVVQPDFFLEMTAPFLEDNEKKIGVTEARQTPIEHHKSYDIITGETSWGSGACTMFRTEVYLGVNGYDADTFFMYCDDVDISWRIRLNGYKIIYRPGAIIFHDKRFNRKGKYVPTETEVRLSLEARLLMAWKWSYPDILKNLLEEYQKANRSEYIYALESFERRRREKRLPVAIDPIHKVGDLCTSANQLIIDYGPARY